MKKVNLTILASLSSSIAFAAGFALYEGSARGNALGGGVMGKAVDASANFYNPATISDCTISRVRHLHRVWITQRSFSITIVPSKQSTEWR